jgi:hypothetical protein
MQAGARDAARTIAVLSPEYLKSVYGGAEWQAPGRLTRLMPAGAAGGAGEGLWASWAAGWGGRRGRVRSR